MIFLKQSTASQEIPLGPFLDDTDGKTAETGLTIANTDIKILKAGATSEVNKNSGGATHIAAGRYYCVLDATDTDTIGCGEVNVFVSGALPVRREFCVLSAAVFDVLFGATAPSTHTAAAVAAATLAAFGVTGTVDDASASVFGFAGNSALSSSNNFYVGSVLAFTGGALDGIARKVTGYTGSSRTFGFANAFPAAPGDGDPFVILGRID